MTSLSTTRDFSDQLRTVLHRKLTLLSWNKLYPQLAELGFRWEDHESVGKERFVDAQLRGTSEKDLVRAAQWYIRSEPTGADRSILEDLVAWLEAGGVQRITDVTRRSLMDALEGRMLAGRIGIGEMITRVGAAGSQYFLGALFEDTSGQLYLQQSVNPFAVIFDAQSSQPKAPPRPLSSGQFLVDWGFLKWPDTRVIRLLEVMVDPSVRSEVDQPAWVKLLSPIIATDGYRLEQHDRISGRPVFRVVRISSGVPGKPKNLIFAANGPKPELGLSDAINNDIVILENAAYCLVYDRPISEQGLLWADLVDWWAEQNHLDPASPEARKTLGERLLKSLDSEPERLLFRTYFKRFARQFDDSLPALVPQVYLHYDPKTLQQLKGQRRIPRQRMDFLLLLPQGTRAVLEIDGKQHYTDSSGAPSPMMYADMVRADRQLKLVGYEVYRFGGYEFVNSQHAEAILADFFGKLFARHGINTGKL